METSMFHPPADPIAPARQTDLFLAQSGGPFPFAVIYAIIDGTANFLLVIQVNLLEYAL